MAKAREEKFVWVTWLSRLMAGETSCHWAPWFKVRYEAERIPPKSELISWKIDHNRQVNELRKSLLSERKKVLSENQVRFRYQISGLTFAGAPDLISLFEDELEIYDYKTGSPRDSDQVQVMIYMYCLPRAKSEFQGKKITGFVVYPQQRIEIPQTIINSQFEENLLYFLSILAEDKEPQKSPSQEECSFCDLSIKDCPEKMS